MTKALRFDSVVFRDPTVSTIEFSFSPEGTQKDSKYQHLVTALSGQAIVCNQKNEILISFL